MPRQEMENSVQELDSFWLLLVPQLVWETSGCFPIGWDNMEELLFYWCILVLYFYLVWLACPESLLLAGSPALAPLAPMIMLLRREGKKAVPFWVPSL